MTALIFICAGAYLFLLLYYLNGWYNLKIFVPESNTPALKISIIVPCRNEEDNIEYLLNDLLKQDYPNDLYEIIVVDDDSKDDTAKIVEEFKSRHSSEFSTLKYIQLKEKQSELKGKKAAITLGVEQSSNDWIVCTDADCRMNSSWLSTIAAFVEKQNPVFVSAPVAFHNENTCFEKMQSLEFLSLIGIGAATISQGSPTMCNGANMAFKKQIFEEVNGYDGNESIASGDDEFLMHKMADKYTGAVKFLKSEEAIVRTHAKKTVNEFWEQRKRWVSKGNSSKNQTEKAMQVFVWIFHLILLLTFIIAVFNPPVWGKFFLLFAIKLFAELIFVIPLSNFFKKQDFISYYFPAAFLYIFYVVIIALDGKFSHTSWKGRWIN